VDLLAKCKDVCFEISPILNLAEGASKHTDFRLSIAPILLGLGFPVTINSDLSGAMGLEDTTYDLFMAAISYNWSLKHFKLMLLHSINHSCTTEGRQKLLLKAFE
jgi:adenosine deaminase